jgi:hypothetical protein
MNSHINSLGNQGGRLVALPGRDCALKLAFIVGVLMCPHIDLLCERCLRIDLASETPHQPHYLCLKYSINNMKVVNFPLHKEDVLRTKQCVNHVQKNDLNMSKHAKTRFKCIDDESIRLV